MKYPIYKPNGEAYITIVDRTESLFGIELLRYKNVTVYLDKKCIPYMIKILTEIQNETIHQ